MPTRREEAIDWCKKVRDLLKIRGLGPLKLKEKDTVASKALTKAIKQVSSKLQLLKKKDAGLFAILKEDLIDIAEQVAKPAYEEKSEDLAALLTARLEHLGNQIQHARGKITDQELNASSDSLDDAERDAYEKALAKAEKWLTELEAKQDGPHQFSQSVATEIELARQLAERASFRAAMLQLADDVDDKYNAEMERYAQYEECQRKLAAANQQIDDLRAIDGTEEIIQSFVHGPLADAGLRFEEFEYAEAIELLDQIDALAGIANSDHDDQRQLKHDLKALLKARGKFSDAKSYAQDRIHEMEQMFGATGAILDLIDTAKQKLEEESLAVQVADDPAEIRNSAASLKSEVKALHKEATARSDERKKAAKLDLKSFGEYTRLLYEAEQAREQLIEVGYEFELGQLQTLIAYAKSQLVLDSGITYGYQTAVETLRGYAEIVQASREKQEEVVELSESQPVPELTQVEQEITSAVFALIDLVTPYQESALRENSANRIEFLRSEVNERDLPVDRAVAELEDYLAELKDLQSDLQAEKQAAEDLFADFEEKARSLLEAGVPDAIVGQIGRDGIDLYGKYAAQHDWPRAVDRLTALLRELERVEESLLRHQENWDEANATLQESYALAHDYIGWRPVAPKANSLREDVETVWALLERTGDYELCLQEFSQLRIKSQLESLRGALDEYSPPDDLETFEEALLIANAEVETHSDPVRLTLRRLDAVKQGKPVPEVLDLQNEFNDAVSRWEEYFVRPQGPIERIEETAAQVVTALTELRRRLEEFANDDDRVMGAIEDVSEEEIRDQRILEQRAGQMADDVVKKTWKPLTRHIKRQAHREFLPYLKGLQAECEDILSMINSRDPYLMDTAQEMIVSLDERFRQVRPKKRDDDATRYREVRQKWSDLSLMLNEKNKIASKLPDTCKQLDAELQAAIVTAMQSSPSDGLALLNELEVKFNEAQLRASLLGEEQTRFKVRAEKLEKQWEEVAKKVQQSIGENANKQPLRKYFTARLADAQAARKREGGMPDAWRLLEHLEEMLAGILSSEDPRGEFQRLDAECSHDQQRIREMAEQFKRARKVFVEDTLPRAKEVVKQLEDGDVELLKSLEQVASSASKLVKPYLNVIDEKKPKEKMQRAPDMAKAGKEFETAWQMLRDAERTAHRLESSGSTNVDASIDFEKLNRHWRTQVDQYKATLDQVANRIADFNEWLAKTEDGDNLSNEQREELGDAASKAADVVRQVIERFRVDVFDDAFTTLAEEKAKDKSQRREQEKRKLAARESALRSMRACRETILKHPVIRELADKQNPFDQQKVMAALGQVRVSLKRIELGTLIGA